MVATIHYRWDFIGLSTQEKPTPETSDKVVDGSTFYSSDDSKLYVWYNDQWYERKALGGGGGGGSTINVVQTTGTSTTDVMSQKAVTDALAGAGGSGVTELTSADYNYPTDNPTSIALWLLEPGVYRLMGNTLLQVNTTDSPVSESGPSTIILNNSGVNTWLEAVMYSYNSILNSRVGRFITTGPDGRKSQNICKEAPTVVQGTGTSDTNVMSQNAVTSMVFQDPATRHKVQVGGGVAGNVQYGVAIGSKAQATGEHSIAIGGGENDYHSARAQASGSIAIGAGSFSNTQGVISVAANSYTQYGYNNTAYRLLSGVHDPVDDHDAANKTYVDTLIAALEARIAALEGN